MKKIIYLFMGITVVMMWSCFTTPTPQSYIGDYHPIDDDYKILVIIENISSDEYNFITKRIEKGDGYILDTHQINETTAELSFLLQDLDALSILQKDLMNIKVKYEEYEELQPILTYSEYIRQYVFFKNIFAGSGAKYLISVTFSPRSNVSIGGVKVLTDNDGKAQFFGIGLNLDHATDGIIYIVDSRNNQAKVVLKDDGKWYVEVIGEGFSKWIEVEAIK